MLFRSGMFALLVAVPMSAQAQFINPFGPCNTCAPPVPPPCMVPMIPMLQRPVVQTHLRPVVETRMRQQQVTTYQPVTTTQVRKEAITVNVPISTTKQVTIDEGAYKMVWVPNMVTKNVVETKIEQQVQYRDVPYQVVQNVPRVHTQLIPERTVRYVPETRTVGVASGCCGATAPMHAMIPQAIPTAIVPTPTTAIVPVPSQSVVQPETALVPTQTTLLPTEQGQWSKVPQRTASASDVELQSYEQVDATQPTTAIAPRRMFTPVPSAATAWRAASALR